MTVPWEDRLKAELQWQALLEVARHSLGLVLKVGFPPLDAPTGDPQQVRFEAANDALRRQVNQLKAHLRVHYPEIPKSAVGKVLGVQLSEGAEGEPPVLLSFGRWPPTGRMPESKDKDPVTLRRDIALALRRTSTGEYPGQHELLRLMHRDREDTRRVREWVKALGYQSYHAMIDDLRPKRWIVRRFCRSGPVYLVCGTTEEGLSMILKLGLDDETAYALKEDASQHLRPADWHAKALLRQALGSVSAMPL
jgi:hypothetical protein